MVLSKLSELSQLKESMGSLNSFNLTAVWRAYSPLIPAWLAFFFGRTLRPGETPLIERFARVSHPFMSPAFCRYTRRLTGVWCAYFVAAVIASYAGQRTNFGTGVWSFVWSGAWVWLGSVALFIGEHRMRPLIFPGQNFPGLFQQVHDTWSVWKTK